LPGLIVTDRGGSCDTSFAEAQPFVQSTKLKAHGLVSQHAEIAPAPPGLLEAYSSLARTDVYAELASGESVLKE
jgi:hypothetical protein